MLKQNDITMIEMERSAVQRDAESQGLSAEKYACSISSVSPLSFPGPTATTRESVRTQAPEIALP